MGRGMWRILRTERVLPAEARTIRSASGTPRRARLAQTLWGHGGSVRHVAYSPDGAWIASGSNDNTIRIWNAETGALTQTLGGHTHGVLSVAFSPDGSQLASSSFSEILIWDWNLALLSVDIAGPISGVKGNV